ncbi:MAG: RNA methyltransferase [Spirochaetes bacterium]|nr:RNA methyltransferase [Spirochaetota bacterium]
MDRTHDISLYSNIRDRDLKGEGIIVAEGRYLAGRLLASGLEILSILCSARMADEFRELTRERCPLHSVSDAEMEGIAGFHFHRGVMAAALRPAFITIEDFLAGHPGCGNLSICPGLSHDENLGSIIRASAALGADGVIIGPRSCDPLSRRALKASMGAAFSLPIVMMDDDPGAFALLKRHGFTIYGASTGEGSVPLGAVRPEEKRAVIFGNEAEGLPGETASLCDEIIHIPMHNDTDSLNVAVAAGIILYTLFGTG